MSMLFVSFYLHLLMQIYMVQNHSLFSVLLPHYVLPGCHNVCKILPYHLFLFHTFHISFLVLFHLFPLDNLVNKNTYYSSILLHDNVPSVSLYTYTLSKTSSSLEWERNHLTPMVFSPFSISGASTILSLILYDKYKYYMSL